MFLISPLVFHRYRTIHTIGEQFPAGVARLESALDVVGVENFVSNVAAGLFEEFVVKLLNSEVFVRFTEFHLAVCIVKDGGTCFLEIDRCLGSRALNGLTATVDTTAGTSHDFDEINLEFAGFNLVEKFFCVCCTGCSKELCYLSDVCPKAHPSW